MGNFEAKLIGGVNTYEQTFVLILLGADLVGISLNAISVGIINFSEV